MQRRLITKIKPPSAFSRASKPDSLDKNNITQSYFPQKSLRQKNTSWPDKRGPSNGTSTSLNHRTRLWKDSSGGSSSKGGKSSVSASEKWMKERSASNNPTIEKPAAKTGRTKTHMSPNYGERSRSAPPSEKWKTERARSNREKSAPPSERWESEGGDRSSGASTSSYRARMEEYKESPRSAPLSKQASRTPAMYKPAGSNSSNKSGSSYRGKADGAKRTHHLATARSRNTTPPKPVKARRNAENFPLETKLITPETTRVSSFQGLLGEEMSDALNQAFKVGKPTQIQTLAIPLILGEEGRQDVLIASETGSGKTLAYLTPVMQALRDQEREESFGVRKVMRPRAVIVLPSRELVAQVTAVAKTLSQFARLRVVGVDAERGRQDILKKFGDKPVDILITSSGSLIKMMGIDKREKIPTTFDPTVKMIRQKSVGLMLSQTTHFVVDEADTMFDDGFDSELKLLMDPLLKKRENVAGTLGEDIFGEKKKKLALTQCQFVFVTATLPSSLSGYFKRRFPELKRITTSGLHSTPKTLKQSFVRLKGNTTKESMLVDIIRRSFISAKKKILVFCNTRASVEKIGALLQKQNGFKSATLLAGDEKHAKTRILGNFIGGGKKTDGDEDEVVDILISTDLASRGLDTVLVDHVVNYDFPSTAIDYIHRVGRTARNGAKGEATSIMGAKSRNGALFDKIEMSSKKRLALS